GLVEGLQREGLRRLQAVLRLDVEHPRAVDAEQLHAQLPRLGGGLHPGAGGRLGHGDKSILYMRIKTMVEVFNVPVIAWPSMTQPNGIEVEGLVRVFKKGPRAVDGIDLEVAPGEIYGFLGPNGAGKSTTVLMLTTLLPPTEGTARVAGHDVVNDGAAVRRVIGAALQEAALAAGVGSIDHGRIVAEGTPAQLKAEIGRSSIEAVPADEEDRARLVAVLERFGEPCGGSQGAEAVRFGNGNGNGTGLADVVR